MTASPNQPPVVLDLMSLTRGMPALSSALGEVHAEAAAVCLENQGHPDSVDLMVNDELVFAVTRPLVTPVMKNAYNDLQNATELGACGVALLLAREVTGLTAVQQSRKGTGFDYWLGPADQPSGTLVFKNSARLEVSGILEGDDKKLKARLKEKLNQSKPTDDTGLPAYAVVVEFGRPQAGLAGRP